MKERRVVLSPEAADDLNKLYDWVAAQASPAVAERYLERIESYCQGLSRGSVRGQLRADLRPGLRITGFERRLTLAFTVDEETVTVLRVFTAGRDWDASF